MSEYRARYLDAAPKLIGADIVVLLAGLRRPRQVGGARAGLQPGELPATARLGRRVHERRDREAAAEEIRVSERTIPWLEVL